MKKTARILSALLVLVLLLTGCQTTPENPTVPSTEPTPPQKLYNYDPDRPLPQKIEKFVAHDAAEGNLVLAKDGVPTATIVVPAGNNKASNAAYDLSKYLTKITGAEFETIEDTQPLGEGNYILVGPTAKTLELGEGTYEAFPKDDGYTIRRHENFLILCGNDSVTFTGTQYAVTRFLEEAGCGWFTLDQLWQPVPSTANLSVKTIDKDFEPRFVKRSVGADSSLQQRWYCGGYATIQGHALPGIVGVGAYDEHPEYFALVGDSRQPDPKQYWQYCYTNPDLAKAIADGVISNFDRNPTLMTFSITANDGWDKFWCECDVCTAAGNHADQLIIFANNVAKHTSEKYPDRMVNFLAYHSTYTPPVNEHTLHPNVELMICQETSPFEDLSKGEQIYDGYHSTNRVTYTQSWKDNSLEYIDKTNAENVSIWMWYCISGSKGWEKYPWVQGNTISNNLDLFEEMGVREIFVDGDGHYDLRWPLYYAAARCMWNEGYDAETWLYDACIKLFGAAADDMFLYYRHLADAAAQYGCTQDAIVWVGPSVTDVYIHDYFRIQSAMKAATEKKDQLTKKENARIENQAKHWANVYIIFGS